MFHRSCLIVTVLTPPRYIQLQEEYIKDEQRYVHQVNLTFDSCDLTTDHFGEYRSLKRELVRAQEEIKRIQSVPLVIGQFMEAIDQKYAFYLWPRMMKSSH